MRNFNQKVLMSIAISALVLSGVSSVKAQDIVIEKYGEVGLRFMPTFTAVKMQSSSNGQVSGNVNLGFGAGLILGLNFTNHVGIQGELIYSSIIQEDATDGVNSKLKLSYVNIPLLLSLNTGKSKMINLNLVAGPQIGFNVGSTFSQTGPFNPNDPQPILAVKKSDLGLAYGFGVDFGLNTDRTFRLGLGYRGVLGLVDISDNNNTTNTDNYYVIQKTKLRTNSIYAGVSLLF